MLTLAIASWLAKLCRRSWMRMRRSPARFVLIQKCVFTLFESSRAPS